MKDADFIIWDLDGTKYRYHDEASFLTKSALARVIQRLMAERGEEPIPVESIIRLAEESYRASGLSWLGFVGKWGIDRETLYREFNDAVPLETVASEPCSLFKGQLSSLGPLGIRQVIFTHGSRRWALKVLNKIELADTFSEEMIFDCSHVGWKLKSEGADAYRNLKGLLNFTPSRTIMVEDSPQCLVGAKDLGLTTVLINRKNLDISGENFIDYSYETPQEFLKILLSQRAGDLAV